jgi:hypothetical protein
MGEDSFIQGLLGLKPPEKKTRFLDKLSDQRYLRRSSEHHRLRNEYEDSPEAKLMSEQASLFFE